MKKYTLLFLGLIFNFLTYGQAERNVETEVYRNKFAKTKWVEKTNLDTLSRILIKDSLFSEAYKLENKLITKARKQFFEVSDSHFSDDFTLANLWFENRGLSMSDPLHLLVKDNKVRNVMLLDGINSNYVSLQRNIVDDETRIDFSSIEHLRMNGNEISTLTFLFDSLTDIHLVNNKVNDIIFRNSVLGETRCHFDSLPRSIAIYDTEIDVLDFGQMVNAKSQHKCNLHLANTKINRIRIDYRHFQIDFDSSDLWKPIEFQNTKNIYLQLQDLFTSQRDYENYELLDKEFRRFQYLYTPSNKNWVIRSVNRFYNFLDKHWWDYGYNKSLIFRNAALILMIFSLINVFIFEWLMTKVYLINKLDHPDYYRSSKLRKMFFATAYTALITFGLKLSLDDINFKKPFGVVLLLIQYLTGLLCLGYLANYVINEGNVGF